MQACVSAANSETARRNCAGDSAKEALMQSLGKADISQTEVQEFIEEGAKNAAGDAMVSCIRAAEQSQTKDEDIAKCKSENVKKALESTLGEDVSDTDIEKFVLDNAKDSAAKAMKAAMETAGTDDAAKETAARNAAKKALEESLGKAEVSETELQTFLNDGAKSAVADAMKACVSTAVDNVAKENCRGSSAKEALKQSLGKADVSALEVEEFIEDGAKDAVGDAMSSCMKVALNMDNDNEKSTAIQNCKSSSVKKALESSLGADVSDVDVETYVRDSAKEAAAEAMRLVMETQKNATNEQREAAAQDAAKKALKLSLGKENVTNLEVRKFINEGAKDAVGDAMKACMEMAGDDTTKQQKCRTETAAKSLAQSLGRSSDSVDQAEVELFIRKAAEEKARKAMEAASKVGATDVERKSATKAALKEALGTGEVTDTDVEEFIEAGAKSAVKSAMTACASLADGITNTTEKQLSIDKCRASSAKQALASSLGKDDGDVKDSDVESFVRNAAKSAIADAMKAAVEDTSLSPTEKRAAAKAALASSLGKASVDDTSFELFKSRGAENAVEDSMKGCMSAASLETDAVKRKEKENRCVTETAKASLMSSTGSVNVSLADVNVFVSRAGRNSAVNSRKNCVAAAGTNQTKRDACLEDRTELKNTVRTVSGLQSVTDALAEAFVLRGAFGKVSELIVSCVSIAGGDGAKLKLCRDDADIAIGNFLGKTSSNGRRRLATLSKGEFEEVKADGASGNVMDMMKACYDGAKTDAEKSACSGDKLSIKQNVLDSLGEPSIDDEEVFRFKRIAQVKAFQQSNEASYTVGDMTVEEKQNLLYSNLKAYGLGSQSEKLDMLDTQIINRKAGALKVAMTAVACYNAKTSKNNCDIESERAKVMVNQGSQRSSVTEQGQIQREGAEELMARHIMGKKAGGGITSSSTYDAVGYDQLREPKYRAADVERSKSRLASDYLFDCQEAGNDVSSCKKKMETLLKNDLKSSESADDVIVRSQFDIMANAGDCSSESAADCNKQVGTKTIKLGLRQTEIKARKYMAAISYAATVQADCVGGGANMEICQPKAKAAFEKLAFGYEQKYIQDSINALAKAKNDGKLTRIKTLKSITSVVTYNEACTASKSEAVKKTVFKSFSPLGGTPTDSIVEASLSSPGSCQLVVSTEFPSTVSDENVKYYAEQSPSTFSVSSNMVSTRRRLATVESSTSVTVIEVDPGNIIEKDATRTTSIVDNIIKALQELGAGIVVLIVLLVLAVVGGLYYNFVYRKKRPRKRLGAKNTKKLRNDPNMVEMTGVIGAAYATPNPLSPHATHTRPASPPHDVSRDGNTISASNAVSNPLFSNSRANPMHKPNDTPFSNSRANPMYNPNRGENRAIL